MRATVHNAASPDQTPCAAAEVAFAEAKAFICSPEAQQMSESELERELHRRGQELIRKLLQGHLDQRSPGKVAAPVAGAAVVARSPQHLEERQPETTCGTVQVARLGESRPETAPRRSSTSRAPPCTASTPRCGNRHHPRSRVRLENAACVPSLPRRHRRDVSVRGRRPNGVYRRTLALGWSRGDPGAEGAASQRRLRCYRDLHEAREYERNHASATLTG